MAHTLTTHFCECHFNTTLLADNTAMLHALIFAAETFIVFYGAKDLGAEKTFSLRLKGTIVYGLGFFNFAKRP